MHDTGRAIPATCTVFVDYEHGFRSTRCHMDAHANEGVSSQQLLVIPEDRRRKGGFRIGKHKPVQHARAEMRTLNRFQTSPASGSVGANAFVVLAWICQTVVKTMEVNRHSSSIRATR